MNGLRLYLIKSSSCSLPEQNSIILFWSSLYEKYVPDHPKQQSREIPSHLGKHNNEPIYDYNVLYILHPDDHAIEHTNQSVSFLTVKKNEEEEKGNIGWRIRYGGIAGKGRHVRGGNYG